MLNIRHFYKIIASIGFIFLGITIYLISKNNATGYELSIYDNLPQIVWIFIVGSFFCGVCITIYSIYLETNSKYNYSSLGIFLAVFTNCLLLSLPLLKGYAFYGRWDALSHIGYIVDILKYGYISDGNVYPITHIYIAMFEQICKIQSTTVFLCFPVLILVYYVLFTYILAKLLISSQKIQLLSALMSTILLTSYGNYQVLPTIFSASFIPLVIYLYFKRLICKKTEVRMVFVLFIMLYPFFHPLTSLLVILFIFFMDIWIRGYDKFFSEKINLKHYSVSTLVPALLSTIIFISWLSNSSNFSIWYINIKNLYYYLKGESYILTASSSITNLFDKMNFQTTDIIELYLKMYGHVSIILMFAGIACLVIVKRATIFPNKDLKYMFLYQSSFLFMCLLIVINLFKTIISMGIWRLISILCIIIPISVSYVISEFILIKSTKNIRKYGAILTILIVMICSIGSILALYPSPWIYQTNQQVSHMEITGMNWYYNHKNPEILDMNIRSSFRFADFTYGIHDRELRNDIQTAERADTNPKYKLSKSLIPNHFNYTNYSRFGDSLNDDIYVPLLKYDEIFYIEMYPQLDVFNSQDFNQFQSDLTIETIYHNGEVTINYVGKD